MTPIQFDQARPVRAYEAIADQIREAIYTGEVRPGERLPAERDLMQQFGVGRTTVREALRVLEAGGLVKSRQGDPKGGAEVQSFSPEILHTSLRSLIHLEGVQDAQLIEFRMIIEGAACYLAAIFRTEEQLEEIQRKHKEIADHAHAGNEDGFRTADATFHRMLALYSGNAIVQAFGEVVHQMVLTLIGQKLEQADDRNALMRESADRHERILTALQQQDAPLAAALATCDIYDYYGKQLDPESSKRIATTLAQLTVDMTKNAPREATGG